MKVGYNRQSAIAKALDALYGVSSMDGNYRPKYNKTNKKGYRKSKRKRTGLKKRKPYKKKDKKYVSDPPADFFFKTTYKKPKGSKSTLFSKQLVQFQENDPHSIACNGGRQESNILPDPICNTTALNTINNQGRVASLTPGSDTTFNTVGPYQYNSFFLSEVKSVYRLTNQSPSTVELKLYLLMAKDNQTIDPDPITDWQTGYTNSSGQSSSIPSRSYTDAEPTESYQFNLNWKVVKRISCKILPGREQKVTWHFEINRLMESGRYNRFPTLRGYTFKWMQSITGGAIGDSSNSFGTGTTVTSVPAKCVGTIANTYKARMCNVFPRISHKDQDLIALTPSGVPTTNLYTIADESGNVVDNAVTTNFA